MRGEGVLELVMIGGRSMIKTSDSATRRDKMDSHNLSDRADRPAGGRVESSCNHRLVIHKTVKIAAHWRV